MSFKQCLQWCICLMIVTSEPACWCIFIRAGEDAEVSNFFNALFQFFLIFPTLSPESLFLLFFSYLQKLLVVTIRLQVFALSFVSLRCLAKTIHDIEQQSFCKSVWKNHSCWRLLLLAPRVFSVLQKQKWVDCFRIVFSSTSKNMFLLSQCSDAKVWATDCYLQSSLQ